jgi:hypothetical protein
MWRLKWRALPHRNLKWNELPVVKLSVSVLIFLWAPQMLPEEQSSCRSQSLHLWAASFMDTEWRGLCLLVLCPNSGRSATRNTKQIILFGICFETNYCEIDRECRRITHLIDFLGNDLVPIYLYWLPVKNKHGNSASQLIYYWGIYAINYFVGHIM